MTLSIFLTCTTPFLKWLAIDIRTGLQTDYREWRKAGRVMVKSLANARKEHFAHAINDSMISTKSKWSSIRNLLHMSNSVNVSLSFLTADRLNQFFNDKLCTIMSNISSRITSLSPPSVPPVPSSATLSQFKSFSLVSIAHVDSLLLSLSKPLPLDVIPYCLLKSCHSTFAILLARLADVSFATGKFPDIYKISQISPLLKKP